MNEQYIREHPEINGGRKRIVRETTHTEIDAETGEITRVVGEDNAYVGTEPEYIKIYTDC